MVSFPKLQELFTTPTKESEQPTFILYYGGGFIFSMTMYHFMYMYVYIA